MSDLKRFQKEHGSAWSTIVQHPAFSAALAVANSEKLKEIMLISDPTLKDNSLAILAELRAHLRYENALLTMCEEKEFAFSSEPTPDYPSQETDLEEQEALARGDVEESDEKRAGRILQSLTPIPAPQVQKPKAKRKKK